MLFLLAVFVSLAYKIPRQPKNKRLSGCLTALAVLSLYFVVIPKLTGPSKEERRQQEEWQQRYQEAEAIFKKQCEQAGEKIYRTVDNAEGVMLLKIVEDDGILRETKSRDLIWDNSALLAS